MRAPLTIVLSLFLLACNDVMIGDHVSLFGDDDSRTKPLRALQALANPGHSQLTHRLDPFGIDAYHRWGHRFRQAH